MSAPPLRPGAKKHPKLGRSNVAAFLSRLSCRRPPLNRSAWRSHRDRIFKTVSGSATGVPASRCCSAGCCRFAAGWTHKAGKWCGWRHSEDRHTRSVGHRPRQRCRSVPSHRDNDDTASKTPGMMFNAVSSQQQLTALFREPAIAIRLNYSS